MGVAVPPGPRPRFDGPERGQGLDPHISKRLGWAWVFVACAASTACHQRDEPRTSIPYHDDFEREQLGEAWYPSGGQWRIEDGKLFSPGGNNAPLFLRAVLPDDVVVAFDVTVGRKVDAKVELMTNGLAHQSGYIFIMGGWDNTLSVVARLDEHGADRVEKKPTQAAAHQTYRWRIEKQGGALRWFVDGELYMTFDDPNPLSGPGHDRFAFSNWQSDLEFDNLSIWPLEQAPPRQPRASASTDPESPGEPGSSASR
ncbi:MAG: hypothetical protein ACFB9M_03145 [Myxococcota bacterium]